MPDNTIKQLQLEIHDPEHESVCRKYWEMKEGEFVYKTSDLAREIGMSSSALGHRIDYLICDANGIPIRAVEYQGSYHQSEEQHKKDRYKKALLMEIGLPMEEVGAARLREIESGDDI